jgi:polysaccharide biosynthesis transport protein
VIKITSPAPRTIQIASEASNLLAAMRQQRNADPAARLLGEPGAESLPLSHIEALISYAAHDAALQQPAEVTPWALRHTLICHLVRQGIRFSDLARIVGTLPAEVTAAYGAILPAAARHSLDETDKVLPALRQFAEKFETQSPQAHS